MIINDTFFYFLQPYSLDIRQPLRSESYIQPFYVKKKKRKKKKKRSNKIHDENDEIRNAFAWQLTVDHKVNMTAEFFSSVIDYDMLLCGVLQYNINAVKELNG